MSQRLLKFEAPADDPLARGAVTARIAEEFILASPTGGNTLLLAKDPVVFPEYHTLFDSRAYFNSGVIGFPAQHGIIAKWLDETVRHHASFRSDQEILNYVLYSRPSQVVLLPQRFNHVRLIPEEGPVAVRHWTGITGKHEIQRQIMAEGPNE